MSSIPDRLEDPDFAWAYYNDMTVQHGLKIGSSKEKIIGALAREKADLLKRLAEAPRPARYVLPAGSTLDDLVPLDSIRLPSDNPIQRPT